MSRLSDFADAVHVRLADATVEKVVGKLNRGRNSQRRRVHWYREGGVIQSTLQAGGRLDEATGTLREPAVLERLETLTVKAFAESEDTLDTLLDNLIVACDQTAPNGSIEWGDYEWGATTKDEFAKRISMVEFTIGLKLPVLDEMKTLTVLTDEDLTCEIDEDL